MRRVVRQAYSLATKYRRKGRGRQLVIGHCVRYAHGKDVLSQVNLYLHAVAAGHGLRERYVCSPVLLNVTLNTLN